MGLNNQSRQHDTRILSISTFRLPFLFWLGILTFALFLWALSSFLVQQNQSRIMQSAEVSVNSLSSFVSDYLKTNQALVKSVVRHHRDEILNITKNSSHANDFTLLNESIQSLFPEGTQFAVFDRSGQVKVSTIIHKNGESLDAFIQSRIDRYPPSLMTVQAHRYHGDEYHFDVVYPIVIADDHAGLWVKFSFEAIKAFIKSLNIKEYDLIINEQTPPYNILVGKPAEQKMLQLKFDFIDDASKDELRAGEVALSIEPIKNVSWQVRALPKRAVLLKFENTVLLISLVVFIMGFILVALLIFVTRQYYSEKEKVKQDAEHDQLFNAGPTVLFEKSTDRSMMINYVSPNSLDILGKEPVDIVGQSYLEWIYDEDVDQVRQTLLDAYRQRKDKVEMVYRIRGVEHLGYRWIYDFTHINYNKARNPENLRGYITSIHAQKTAEKNAIELIRSVPEAIIVTDLDGMILNMNQAAEAMLGVQQNRLRELDFCLYLESKSRKAYEKYKHKRFKNDAFTHSSGLGALDMTTPSGQKISVEISLNRIEMNGKPVLVQVVRDVTLQVKTQQQLSDAKEQAESLARARSRFVATISHEIRTPMNGVLGMADLLSRTQLSAVQGRYLAAIQQSGKTLLQIINEVLDFAKLDEGHIKLVNEKIDIQQLASECVHLLSVQAEDKGLDLNLVFNSEFDAHSSFVGDGNRIKQLLLNLLSNAIKFTEQGRVEVEVTLHGAHDASIQTVELRVKDTGIGIEASKQSRLFDSFTQADDSTSRRFGGTGLGLAITKQLVDLMHGEVGMSSQFGEGSEFWVKLPLAKVVNRVHSTESSRPLVMMDDDRANWLSGKTVLLVEDNDINQRVIEAFLVSLGAKVDIAENGLEGLDFWRVNPSKYHLILMDIQMPIMDGLEATRMIRREEVDMQAQYQIPILALTANVVMEDKQNCMMAGMNEFMAKPIDRELFERMVFKWVLK